MKGNYPDCLQKLHQARKRIAELEGILKAYMELMNGTGFKPPEIAQIVWTELRRRERVAEVLEKYAPPLAPPGKE